MMPKLPIAPPLPSPPLFPYLISTYIPRPAISVLHLHQYSPPTDIPCLYLRPYPPPHYIAPMSTQPPTFFPNGFEYGYNTSRM